MAHQHRVSYLSKRIWIYRMNRLRNKTYNNDEDNGIYHQMRQRSQK